ncbi:MAG: hypothetical protein RL375_4245 [Pseudomonadota bacterium]
MHKSGWVSCPRLNDPANGCQVRRCPVSSDPFHKTPRLARATLAQCPQGYTHIDARCTSSEQRVLQQLRRCLQDDELAWLDESIDDAVRLLYVGMTRAAHELLLSSQGSSVIVDGAQQALVEASRRLV